MSVAVSADQRFAYSVGADHHLGAYRLVDAVRLSTAKFATRIIR